MGKKLAGVATVYDDDDDEGETISKFGNLCH